MNTFRVLEIVWLIALSLIIPLSIFMVARAIDRLAAAGRAESIERVKRYALSEQKVTLHGVLRALEGK